MEAPLSRSNQSRIPASAPRAAGTHGCCSHYRLAWCCGTPIKGEESLRTGDPEKNKPTRARHITVQILWTPYSTIHPIRIPVHSLTIPVHSLTIPVHSLMSSVSSIMWGATFNYKFKAHVALAVSLLDRRRGCRGFCWHVHSQKGGSAVVPFVHAGHGDANDEIARVQHITAHNVHILHNT